MSYRGEAKECLTFRENVKINNDLIDQNLDIFYTIFNEFSDKSNIYNDLLKSSPLNTFGFNILGPDENVSIITKCTDSGKIILNNKIATLKSDDTSLPISNDDIYNIYYALSTGINDYCKTGTTIESIQYQLYYVWYFKFKDTDYVIYGDKNEINVGHGITKKQIQNILRGYGPKQNYEKYGMNFQDYYLDLVGTSYGIKDLKSFVKKILKEYSNLNTLEIAHNYDQFIESIDKLNNKYREWLNKQDEKTKNKLAQNPFVKLSSRYFKEKILRKFAQSGYYGNLNLSVTNSFVPNSPELFDYIEVDLTTVDDFRYIQIKKIQDAYELFDREKKIKNGVNFMETIMKYLEKINDQNDYLCLRLINILVKLPYDLYKLTETESDTSQSIVLKLCKKYKSWLIMCSNIPIVHIYKYAYYLLINKLFRFTDKDIFSGTKGSVIRDEIILEEFIIDVNEYPLIDLGLIKIIKDIKEKLSEIKIWYWNNYSFEYLLNETGKIIKGNDESIILTTRDLNLNLRHSEEIGYRYFKAGKEFNFSDYRNVDANMYWATINADNYAPPLQIDSKALCFKFPDVENMTDLLEIDKILILTQMVHSLKKRDPYKTNFPKDLPNSSINNKNIYQDDCNQGEKQVMIDENLMINTSLFLNIVEEDGKKNYIYTADFNIIEKNLENSWKEIGNEYNTIKNKTSNKYQFINNFINFVNSGNEDYLYSELNPFINYGLELIKNNTFEPVSYEDRPNNGEESFVQKEYFKIKECIDALLKIENTKAMTDFDFDLYSKTLGFIPGNLYLFTYLYVCEKNNQKLSFINDKYEEIMSRYTNLNLDDVNDNTLKLMIMSNIIKLKSIKGEFDDIYFDFLKKIIKENTMYQTNYPMNNKHIKLQRNIFPKIDELNRENILYEDRCINLPYINLVIPYAIIAHGTAYNRTIMDNPKIPGQKIFKQLSRQQILDNYLKKGLTLYQKQEKGETLDMLFSRINGYINSRGKQGLNYCDYEVDREDYKELFEHVMCSLFGRNYENEEYKNLIAPADDGWKYFPRISPDNPPNQYQAYYLRYFLGNDDLTDLKKIIQSGQNLGNFRPNKQIFKNLVLGSFDLLPNSSKRYITMYYNKLVESIQKILDEGGDPRNPCVFSIQRIKIREQQKTLKSALKQKKENEEYESSINQGISEAIGSTNINNYTQNVSSSYQPTLPVATKLLSIQELEYFTYSIIYDITTSDGDIEEVNIGNEENPIKLKLKRGLEITLVENPISGVCEMIVFSNEDGISYIGDINCLDNPNICDQVYNKIFGKKYYIYDFSGPRDTKNAQEYRLNQNLTDIYGNRFYEGTKFSFNVERDELDKIISINRLEIDDGINIMKITIPGKIDYYYYDIINLQKLRRINVFDNIINIIEKLRPEQSSIELEKQLKEQKKKYSETQIFSATNSFIITNIIELQKISEDIFKEYHLALDDEIEFIYDVQDPSRLIKIIFKNKKETIKGELDLDNEGLGVDISLLIDVANKLLQNINRFATKKEELYEQKKKSRYIKLKPGSKEPKIFKITDVNSLLSESKEFGIYEQLLLYLTTSGFKNGNEIEIIYGERGIIKIVIFKGVAEQIINLDNKDSSIDVSDNIKFVINLEKLLSSIKPTRTSVDISTSSTTSGVSKVSRTYKTSGTSGTSGISETLYIDDPSKIIFTQEEILLGAPKKIIPGPIIFDFDGSGNITGVTFPLTNFRIFTKKPDGNIDVNRSNFASRIYNTFKNTTEADLAPTLAPTLAPALAPVPLTEEFILPNMINFYIMLKEKENKTIKDFGIGIIEGNIAKFIFDSLNSEIIDKVILSGPDGSGQGSLSRVSKTGRENYIQQNIMDKLYDFLKTKSTKSVIVPSTTNVKSQEEIYVPLGRRQPQSSNQQTVSIAPSLSTREQSLLNQFQPTGSFSTGSYSTKGSTTIIQAIPFERRGRKVFRVINNTSDYQSIINNRLQEIELNNGIEVAFVFNTSGNGKIFKVYLSMNQGRFGLGFINEGPSADNLLQYLLDGKIKNERLPDNYGFQKGGFNDSDSDFSDSSTDISFSSDSDSDTNSDSELYLRSKSNKINKHQKSDKLKGGADFKDLPILDYFFEFVQEINKIKVPELYYIKEEELKYDLTMNNMIVQNLFYFLTIMNTPLEIDINKQMTFTYNEKIDKEVYAINNIDNQIFRIYLDKELKDQTRKVYITGKDFFKLYVKSFTESKKSTSSSYNLDIFDIYNKSPYVENFTNISFPKSFIKAVRNGIPIKRGMVLSKQSNPSTIELKLTNMREGYECIYEKESTQLRYLEFIQNYDCNTIINEQDLGNIINFNTRGSYFVGDPDYIRELIFEGYINYDENGSYITLITPIYITNPVFYDGIYFNYESNNINSKYPNRSGKFIPTDKNNICKDRIFKLEKLNNDNFVIIENDNLYVDIRELDQESYLLKKLLGITSDPKYILCWKDRNSKNVVSIDILDKQLHLMIQYDDHIIKNIILNNLYEIIFDYRNLNWNITKWICSSKLLLTREKNIDYYQSKYYLILIEEESHVLIELNKNTYLPIIKNKETLKKLANVLNKCDSPLFKELVPLIVKYNLINEYGSNRWVNIYQNIPENLLENNPKINYNITYDLIEITDKLQDIYYEKYYCPDSKMRYFVSLGEYMLYSLTSLDIIEYTDRLRQEKTVMLKDLAFSIFFTKLATSHDPKWGPIPSSPYVYNPLEFYYQFIFGSFATEEQLNLANNIFEDLVQKQTLMTGGYKSEGKTYDYRMSYYYNINPTEYKSINRRPKIYNLIMGRGKTKVITPLVILKYLQYLTTLNNQDSKQNCFIVLPENLVNQSLEHLKSILDMYFPICVNKCEESRKKIIVEQKPSTSINIKGLRSVSNIVFDEKNQTTYTSILENKASSEKFLDVFVISDTSLKCGFLNSYKLVKQNMNNNIYLFDEADTILNPLISELNYPDGKEKSIDYIDLWYNLIHCLLSKIYKGKSQSFTKILEKYPNEWSNHPHFNVINPSVKFIEEIKLWALCSIIKYYRSKEPLIYNFMRKQSNINDIIGSTKSIEILNTLYIIYDFVNSVFLTVLNMIDRVNYGIHISKDGLYIAIPFNYNEDPSIGSKFSNPLLTICLTMTEYILSTNSNPIKNLSDDNLNKIIELMKNEYNSIPKLFRNQSAVYKAYLRICGSENIIDIRDIQNINILTQEQIQRLRTDEYLICLLSKDQCSKIKIDINRESISGFDLFMSFNLNNRVGFTGTTNIPQVVDIDLQKEIEIIINNKEIDKINKALQNYTQIYVALQTEYTPELIHDKKINTLLLESLKNVKSNELKLNTIIDIGGVFVGYEPDDIFNTVLKYVKDENRGNVPQGFQFIYFGEFDEQPDVKITVNEHGNKQKWSDYIGNSQNIYYYYDQRHTTGTDAPIPANSLGLAFLNKNSRWRDVVQGVYRMRGFGEAYNEGEESSVNVNQHITFVINNKIVNLIEGEVGTGMKNDLKPQLFKWFDKLEDQSKQNQLILGYSQNIKSLSRLTRKEQPFNSTNDFKFFIEENISLPREDIINLIKGNTSWQSLEMIKIIKDIRPIISQNSTEITKLISDYERSDKTLISQLGSSSHTIITSIEVNVAEAISMSQQQNIQDDINKPREKTYNPPNEEPYAFTIQDYFTNPLENPILFYTEIIHGILYESINLKLINDTISSHVIYFDNIMMEIPNIEGFKLIDYLTRSENINGPYIPEEFIIFDNKGVVYLTKFKQNSQMQKQKTLITSYVKFVFDRYFFNHLSLDDYINLMIYLRLLNRNPDQKQRIETILSSIKSKSLSDNITKLYVDAIRYYIDPNTSVTFDSINIPGNPIINLFTIDGTIELNSDLIEKLLKKQREIDN